MNETLFELCFKKVLTLEQVNDWSKLPSEICSSLLRSLCMARNITDKKLIDFIQGFSKNGRILTSLSLDNAGNLLSDASLSILSSVGIAEHIQMLDISRCFSFTEKTISQTISKLTSLQSISFDRTSQVTDSIIHSLPQNTILSLNLTRCSQISDKALLEFISNYQNGQQILSLVLFSCSAVSEKSLFSVSTHCHNLRSLSLARCSQVSDNSLLQILNSCSQISDLCLSRCRKLTPVSLSKLVLLPHLEILDLTSISLISEDCLLFIFSQLHSIRILYLSDCSSVTDQVICCISSSCCNSLQKLFLSGQSKLTGISIRSILSKCQSLKTLNISACSNVTDESFTGTEHPLPPDLEVLNFSGCSQLTPRTLCRLSELTKLRCVEASHCKRLITDFGVECLAKECLSLELIDFSSCPQIGDRGLSEICNSCKKLRWLTVSNSQQITEFGLIQSLKKCHFLELLNLTGCPNVTFRVIQIILMSCRKLQRLDISNCQGLCADYNERHINELQICKHPVLESVFISGNPNLSSIVYQQLSGCIGLRSLLISGINALTDSDICKLVLSIHTLRHIDLSDCLEIGDDTLVAIAKQCSLNLTTLIVEGCIKITDSGAIFVIRQCKNLSLFNLSGCVNITDLTAIAAKESIASNNGNLSQLFVKDCKIRSSFAKQISTQFPRLQIIQKGPVVKTPK